MGKMTGAGELVLDDLQTLYTLGVVGTHTDGQLIASFLAGDADTSGQAFRALVDRHGPMVLGVCQRILGDRHEAEDAFQATFLVLAKRAHGIRRSDSVGGWLHRVARRIAVRAGKLASRRRPTRDVSELDEVLAETRDPGQPLEQDELGRTLDQEIDCLQESCRQVIILCDLEGLTYEQAAERLRFPVGTVKSRLFRARGRLRERLSRRGVTLENVGGAAALWTRNAVGSVSPALAEGTVKIALGQLAGKNVVPDLVEMLMRKEMRNAGLSLPKLVMATVLVLGVPLGLWGAGFFSGHRPGRQVRLPENTPRMLVMREQEESKPAAKNAGVAATISATGRVVDAQGHAVAGARIFIREWAVKRTSSLTPAQSSELVRVGELPDILAQGETDKEGHFQLKDVVAPSFPSRENQGQFEDRTFPWDMIVLAKGHSLAWVRLTPEKQREPLTVTLGKEASIRGRITRVDGKPIEGARIRAIEIAETSAGIREFGSSDHRLDLGWSSVPVDARTSNDGRFVLAGLPPDRRITLHLRADGYQWKTVYASTTAQQLPDLVDTTFHFSRRETTKHPIHTGDFVVQMKATDHRLQGTLVFEETGEPAAGTQVLVGYTPKGKTDSNGRFLIEDLAAGTIQLHAYADRKDYAPLDLTVEIPETEKRIERTFKLPRGLAVSGRVVDSAGKSVEGAKLRYENSPQSKGISTLFGLQATTDSTGRFHLNVPAGPGFIVVYGAPRGLVRPGLRFVGSAPEDRLARPLDGKSGTIIDNLSFTLYRGRNATIHALDPEGHSLAGVEVRSYEFQSHPEEPLLTNKDGLVELSGLARGGTITLDLIHREKKLGGRVELLDNQGSEFSKVIDRKLSPLGSLTGSVLDENNKPIKTPSLILYVDAKTPESIGKPISQRNAVAVDGAFRFDELIPGASYYVSANADGHAWQNSKRITAETGATQQLEPLRLPSALRSLSGVVVDPRGKPVAGVTVGLDQHPGRLLYNASGRWFMTTDVTGRFDLNKLPSGPLSIRAFRSPNGPDRQIRNSVREDVGENQTEIRIVIPDLRRRLQGIED